MIIPEILPTIGTLWQTEINYSGSSLPWPQMVSAINFSARMSAFERRHCDMSLQIKKEDSSP